MAVPGSSPPSRILVIDDDPDILKLVGDSFSRAEEFPNETILLGEPKAGVERLEDGRLDVVITDYKMPDMDGVALLIEAKRRVPGAIRVLMTAFPSRQAVVDGVLAAQVHAYIEKPFRPASLVETVREALARRDAERAGFSGFVARADKAAELVESVSEHLGDAPAEFAEATLSFSFPTTAEVQRLASKVYEGQRGEVREIRLDSGRFVVTLLCHAPGKGVLVTPDSSSGS